MPNLQHLCLDHESDLDLDDPDAQELFDAMSDYYLRHAHLPGLGPSKDLEKLETLTLSTIALYGTHHDDVFDADGDDSPDPDAVHYTLEDLLPASLQKLTGES